MRRVGYAAVVVLIGLLLALLASAVPKTGDDLCGNSSAER
jgi:hypothetical protein